MMQIGSSKVSGNSINLQLFICMPRAAIVTVDEE